MTLSAGIQQMKAADPARFNHGDRNRYLLGCRCEDCRAGAAAYAREWRIRSKIEPWNGFVSAARARRHLLALQQQGIGRDTVAAASDVPLSTIVAVRQGVRLHIRASTERRLLAVTRAQAPDAALVDAGPTWVLIGELLQEGYRTSEIAKMLGFVGRGIPLNRERVTVRNAAKVAALHRRLTGDQLLPPIVMTTQRSRGRRARP